MDAWLTDVQKIRIPRPKYSSSNSSTSALKSITITPSIPPRDYEYEFDLTKNCRQETHKSNIMVAEDLQRAFQEKL